MSRLTNHHLQLLYFSFFAAAGCLMPYVAPYLHHRGLSDHEIGILFAMGSLAFVVSPFLLGVLADARLGPARLFRWTVLLAALSIGALSCAEARWAIWLCFVLMVFSRLPGFGLLDGMCFAELETRNKESSATVSYETIRIWGSLGYAVATFLAFALLEFTGGLSHAAIVGSAVLMFLCWLCSLSVASTAPGRATMPHASVFKDPAVFRLIRARPLSTFLGSFSLLMLSVSIFDSFHGRYFQELGLPEKYLGPIWGLGILAEIGFVWLCMRWMHRLSTKFLMSLAAVAVLVRQLCFACGASLPILLASQLAYGPVALGLYFLPQKFLDSRIPSQYRNSLQGFMRSACMGIPMFIGPIAGGWLADSVAPGDPVGLQSSFWFASGAALIAVIWIILDFRESRPHILNPHSKG